MRFPEQGVFLVKQQARHGEEQRDPSAGQSQTTELLAAIPLTAKKNEPSSQELCVAGKDKLL